MQVVFVDPPERDYNRGDRPSPQAHPWDEIAAQLRERPGEWALCLRDVPIVTTPITQGRINAFKPAGSFEARTVQAHKRTESGRALVDLYIRYIATPPEEPK